jgi:hypothetical protein
MRRGLWAIVNRKPQKNGPKKRTCTGHSLRSATRILEVYLARTKALATAAIVKLNEHSRNKTA